MGPPHEVTVPAAKEPVWPPGCVACGGPESSVPTRLRAAGLDWYRVMPGGVGNIGSPRLAVPLCARCAAEVRRGRRLRAAMNWGMVIPAAVIALWTANAVNAQGPLRPVVIVGVGVAAMLPVWIIEAFVLPAAPVDVVHRAGRRTYQFRDEPIAREFAELNSAEVT